MKRHRQFVIYSIVLTGFLGMSPALAQFSWPVTPFNLTQEISGNFAEFRDTGSADHFHNGTDIPKPDRSPVYAVKDGLVTNMVRTGSNAYVRVQDMAYVHILPAPSLGLGDHVVAAQTILGTILPGQGHVHFTNGYVGSERNSLLPGSGLTPFVDLWPPIVRYIRFYRNRSTEQFELGKVSGPVDIIVKVDEQNGPASSRLSRRNNGTYKIGYKILSADSATVIAQPPNGIRFQFDTKPSNGWVHNVFSDHLSSTTSHAYLVTNEITADGFWDTEILQPGSYVIMAYAIDTRDNADTLYQAIQVKAIDLDPPSAPEIRLVTTGPNKLQVGWAGNEEVDLEGYRLQFTYDKVVWRTRLDESVLKGSTADTSFAVALNRDIYFRLLAIDDAAIPNLSPFSDVYGASDVNPDNRILIVDGFDRFGGNGSWQLPWHDLVTAFGSALAANGYGFDSASNDAVLRGDIVLADYRAVFWLLGDEAADNETFSAAEQQLVEAFLAGGGKLFVSGSEIAWDLDPDSDSGVATESDEHFLNTALRVDYANNDAGVDSVLGVPASIFAGLSIEFGQTPYGEDSPDVIRPAGQGTQPCLLYDDAKIAAVQFTGPIGGTTSAQIVFLAFPFETISGASDREAVMGRILNYFFTTTAVADHPETAPTSFQFAQNYPNPFNPETKLSFTLPTTALISLEIFNALGQRVKTLIHGIQPAGRFVETWQGLDSNNAPVTSGVYFARLIAFEPNGGKQAVYRQTILMTIMR